MAHEALDEVEVVGTLDADVPLSRINRESVVKKEIITKERVHHKNATSLARALDLEPGVQTTVTCANCGSQRVTLNGLRGENTTVLIDGIPAFSSVSSFYGMEAVPLVGLSHIEIMRGAGASLTAPEAIGGAINLVTAKTDSKGFTYQMRAGENEFFNQQFQGVYGDARGGTLVAAQTSQLGHFDQDNNNVAESSRQLQHSLFLKRDQRIGNKIKVSARFGYQNLELIGGTTQLHRPSTFPANLPQPDDFPQGDVRNNFEGDLSKITDLIRLKRLDGGGSFLYHINNDMNAKFSFSLAQQSQHSIYSHGYDYDNEDMFRFFDLKVNKVIGDDHFLTIGVDHRNEDMASSSDYLYQVNNFKRDSFKYETLGFYIQDEWFLSKHDELNLVLRFDTLDVNWQDKTLINPRLNKSVIAPRFHYKRIHNEHFSSRFSYGVGYRAPLTLFESQHGANENGFELEIKDLERAQSVSYTLNFDTEKRSSAASFSITQLENMAWGDENQTPIVFKNADETMNISTANLLHVERINSNWTLEGSFDWFIMPDSYKGKLFVAAQETRARFISDFHWGKNELVTFLNIVGPRNLGKYQYGNNYNVLELDPETFEEVASDQKGQRAPLFYTLDLIFNREITKGLLLTGGVTNLFNYTQTRDRESPLAWRLHGNHYHLDNRHLWGPTQGRTAYVGFRWSL
jgi:outer membrane receptor for ferrienterochelin and colicins